MLASVPGLPLEPRLEPRLVEAISGVLHYFPPKLSMECVKKNLSKVKNDVITCIRACTCT